MSQTSIQWTDRTWNPVRGCSMAKGSETGGCLNCYAARMAARNLPEMRSPRTGEPFALLRESGPRWTGDVELIDKKLDEPLRWKKPQRVFVNSMSDLFHEGLPYETTDRVFAVMAACGRHTFQILTKRPERMLEYVTRFRTSGFGSHGAWPLPNVWLGTSVENQVTADVRIPLLTQVPAAVRFISYEPALGPVNFEANGLIAGLDWIIVGGESGPGARPFAIEWALHTIEQCEAAGVACFVKQLGAVPALAGGEILELADRKGGDLREWPEGLQVRRFPEPGV